MQVIEYTLRHHFDAPMQTTMYTLRGRIKAMPRSVLYIQWLLAA